MTRPSFPDFLMDKTQTIAKAEGFPTANYLVQTAMLMYLADICGKPFVALGLGYAATLGNRLLVEAKPDARALDSLLDEADQVKDEIAIYIAQATKEELLGQMNKEGGDDDDAL